MLLIHTIHALLVASPAGARRPTTTTAAMPQPPRPRVRLVTSSATAVEWGALDAPPPSREAARASLDALKAQGDAALWGSFPRLAPRAVSLRELCMATSLDETALDPTASEFSMEDISGTFVKVLLGCSAAAFAWAGLAPVDDTLRFTGTYLIGAIPIAVLAIGSVAPGLLFLPFEALKSATAQQETRERVVRHEAAHLLTAYCLGMPIESVSAGGGGGAAPRVVIYDEEAVQRPGALVDAEAALPRLAVVALSGLVAEADAYGRATGASADLALLDQLLLRATPPIEARAQQDTARFAALMAWTIQRKHARALDALCAALGEGEPLGACLRAAEAAERVGDGGDSTSSSA